MIQAALGMVDKMQIEVYDKPDYQKVKNTIYVQFNPDKYSISINSSFVELQPEGSDKAQLVFNSKQSDKISFDFLFDGTGVVPPGKIDPMSSTKSIFDTVISTVAAPYKYGDSGSISKDVESFKQQLTGYNSSTHDVPYLKLVWGDYLFQCRLIEMVIQFTLFNPQGRPLRAVAKCSFQATETIEKSLKELNKNSPDMTHERTFIMGDKLPLMAENIYDSPDYYIDTAKANNLLSFRKIAVGTTIIFPPIK